MHSVACNSFRKKVYHEERADWKSDLPGNGKGKKVVFSAHVDALASGSFYTRLPVFLLRAAFLLPDNFLLLSVVA